MLSLFYISLTLLVLFVGLLCFLAWYLAADGYQGPLSDHFDGTHFKSYGPKPRIVLKSDFHPSIFKWMLERRKNTWKRRENAARPNIQKRILGSEIKATYINHSTFLIQLYGTNILTDPVFANRASPFPFLGPKRYRAPGIALSDLPPIDLVLLSHNHYDHLDLPSLRMIAKRWNPKIITGLGNSAYLLKKGIRGAEDIDWFDKRSVDDNLTIVGLPAQHFSARSLSDRNKTLWMGFAIETPGGVVYFAGDTGYGPFIEKIKEQYSSFALAFLPIGAYLPPWMMAAVHVSPDEAVLMHTKLNIKKSIAIHFGTFRLADDAQDEPRRRLEEILKTKKDIDFSVLENGEEFEMPL